MPPVVVPVVVPVEPEEFPWSGNMEKLKRLRRESVESGLTIREARLGLPRSEI